MWIASGQGEGPERGRAGGELAAGREFGGEMLDSHTLRVKWEFDSGLCLSIGTAFEILSGSRPQAGTLGISMDGYGYDFEMIPRF